jgi:hypothetical protein
MERKISQMVEQYIRTPVSKTQSKELEVRFETGASDHASSHKINSIDFSRIIQQLKSTGFELTKEESYLRVIPTEMDDGTKNTANIRLDIQGLDMIESYCQYNDIQKVLNLFSEKAMRKMKFTKKTPISSEFSSIKCEEYHYRVACNLEEDYTLTAPVSKDWIKAWLKVKKLFRYIKRYQFSHPTLSVLVDISIVKTNQRSKQGNIVPTYTLQSANVMKGPKNYELEIEWKNHADQKLQDILQGLRKSIHIMLCAIQATHYPLSYVEQDFVLNEYMNLIYTQKKVGFEPRPFEASDFFGPSTVTLQIEQLMPTSVDNVLTDFAITEKADGDRKMLFICPSSDKDKEARIYLIDMAMHLTYTGKTTTSKDLFYTLIDGEHVLFDKQGNYINYYLCFDIYFTSLAKDGKGDGGGGVKAIYLSSFIKTAGDKGGDVPELPKKYYRYSVLKDKLKNLKTTMIDRSSKQECVMSIEIKDFHHRGTLFENAATILNNTPYFIYNTDGLILTPCRESVPIHPAPHSFKTQWNHCYKWKPPQYNTIDFYVRAAKDEHGQPVIKQAFQSGNQLNIMDQDQPYQVFELCCGVNRKNDNHKNPFHEMLKLLKKEDIEPVLQNYEENYRPERFIPKNPYDPQAYLCYVKMERNNQQQFVVKTKEGEIFGDHTIVEFERDLVNTYDSSAWRWKPLRFRFDKTAKLLDNIREFGNAFHVADQNWHSIHFPITQSMMSTGEHIPSENTDIYYDVQQETKYEFTKPMRSFHNIVKRKLIYSVAQLSQDKSFMDLAVGKGGDLQKWQHAGISFVLGIDISRDNIHNDKNGACMRYLDERKKIKKDNMLGLFLVGDASQHIRSGEAMSSTIDQELVRTVFATTGTQQPIPFIQGIGKEGFQIVSCQFAVHYFFKNRDTLHGFLQNVAECTKLGGYFIGTTYDGKSIFDQLKRFQEGEGIIFSRKHPQKEENIPIYKLIRKYKNETWEDNESSLGYTISVFQDSIGKSADEFLVNFEFLKQIMSSYGFIVIDKLVDPYLEMPEGTSMFESLYHDMMKKWKETQAVEFEKAHNMKEDEKTISFFNRYFIFKKVFEVDALQIRAQFDKNNEQQSKKKTLIVKKKSEKFTLKKPEPVVKVAIIVPYRPQVGKNRSEQLKAFLKYMTEYLQYSGGFKIFIVEQTEGQKFNRGELLNIGYLQAKEEEYNYFIFHDVDLLPSTELKQYYVETNPNPVHLAFVWKERYNYEKYLGGVVAMTGPVFESMNGYPNDYWGWGGEDDELYSRVHDLKYKIVQPPQGSYEDLEHMNLQEKLADLKKADVKCMNKKELNKNYRERWPYNGLNSVEFNLESVVHNMEHYKHLLVKLAPPSEQENKEK